MFIAKFNDFCSFLLPALFLEVVWYSIRVETKIVGKMSNTVFASASSSSGPQTLIDSIRRNAANNSAAPAIVVPNRPSLSYSALLLQVEQFGSELRRVGIGTRSRVAVAISDDAELAIAIIAISCSAAVIPIDPKLTRAEIEDLFSACKIDALVAAEDTNITVREVAARHGASLFLASSREGSFGLTLCALSGEGSANDVFVRPNDPALILRTSGTTGRPKLVVVTHENLLSMAMRLQGWFNLGPSDRVLCVMPLHYAQGLKVSLFSPLILGGSVAIPLRSPKFTFFYWLRELRPTWYSAGPTFHHQVLDAGRSLRGSNFSHSLRFIFSGAAPLADSQRAKLEALFGIPVLDAYGLSEAGAVAANSIDPRGRRRGTVGKFRRGELAIQTDDGRIVDKGGPGEIVVRGAGVSPGYINCSETSYSVSDDGWFKTGDLGRIDDDGFLTICGRIKEIIVRGGEKVSPAEIDAALLNHPAVADVAAFAVPHPRLGEDIAAAVVIQPGASATPQELRLFLRDTLSAFKLPRRIHLVDSLPKGTTGKIQREKLSQTFGNLPKKTSDLHWRTTLEIEIAEIWQKLLNCQNIKPEDDFFELGGDSLLAAQMLIEIERLTGMSLPETLLFDNTTVRDLANSVVPSRRYDDQNLLLQLQPGTGGKPFIFLDGDFRGGGYYVRHLASQIGPKWPFYALRSHGMLGGPTPSIEKMAEHYMRLLDDAGITGPVRIGGHCNGAFIALELAHQLEATGRDVELVAMIEAISLNARPTLRLFSNTLETALNFLLRRATSRQEKTDSIMSWVWRHIESANQQFNPKRPLWQSLPWWAARMAMQFLSRPRYASKPHAGPRLLQDSIRKKKNGTSAETDNDMRMVFNRMSAYIPKPVNAKLFVIVSESSSKDPKFFSKVWQQFTAHSEYAVVPGAHLTCVSTMSHAAALAKTLRNRFVALDKITDFNDRGHYSKDEYVRASPSPKRPVGFQSANDLNTTSRSDLTDHSTLSRSYRRHSRP
jgi:acyl-CoA synthetase (AMP-forming)/AMP-acid ligase II/thioesterase domain-containing protein/acyl carrier protein